MEGHNGRRYFSRREINALVSGPDNMAVYCHILVIPPTGNKVLPPKNEKPPPAKTLPPYCITAEKYRHILVLPLPPKNTANSRHQKVPPTLNTAKRVPPTLDTAQKVPPTLDTAQKVPPMLASYHRKGTAYTGYRPKKYRLFSWCSFFVLRSFWFFGLLFGRTSLWT